MNVQENCCQVKVAEKKNVDCASTLYLKVNKRIQWRSDPRS